MNDPRAKQALYLAQGNRRPSSGIGRGIALRWVIGGAAILGGAIWIFVSLM